MAISLLLCRCVGNYIVNYVFDTFLKRIVIFSCLYFLCNLTYALGNRLAVIIVTVNLYIGSADKNRVVICSLYTRQRSGKADSFVNTVIIKNQITAVLDVCRAVNKFNIVRRIVEFIFAVYLAAEYKLFIAEILCRCNKETVLFGIGSERIGNI